MDSNEEISDNILSYILDSVRDSESSVIIEGENVSTATDNDINNGSELDNSLNPLTSPSLTSAFSSKKLEWDSSADVGCLPEKTPQVKSKLSTLERMALSNSASRLCLDEDERSLALIAKIDRVLARSKVIGKSRYKIPKKLQKLPTWPSVDSGSNASVDTVIPIIPDVTSAKKNDLPYESQPHKLTEPNLRMPSFQKQSAQYQTQVHKQSHTSSHAKPPLRRSKSTPQYEECTSELFITKSAADKELGLYASNEAGDGSIPVTPTNFVDTDRDQTSSQCRCVSSDYSESPCPTHISLSSEHARRMRTETLGELQVYRGLKEHLKNLKDYVAQLEQTWKFLDRASAAHLGTRERTRDEPSRHFRSSRKQPVMALDETQYTSRSSLVSEVPSSPVNSALSLRSDRSFELERLNLHDTDSTEDSRPVKTSKTKCCNHCSLKKSSSTTKKKSKNEKSVQTSDIRPGAPAVRNNVIVPQREPVAYDITLDDLAKPKEPPRNKTTLQEALKEKRPDFYEDSERRRKAIQEISQMRRTGMSEPNFAPHLFTYHELRKHTEELCRQMPEFRNRNRDQKRKETVVSNRIKASVFQKKLQSRVLQGQLNLPHSTHL